jgi:hypothetical protein
MSCLYPLFRLSAPTAVSLIQRLMVAAWMLAACSDPLSEEEGAEPPPRTDVFLDPLTLAVEWQGEGMASLRLQRLPQGTAPVCSAICTRLGGNSAEQNLLESGYVLGTPIDGCSVQCAVAEPAPLAPGEYELIYRWGVGGNTTRGDVLRFEVQ